MHEFVPASRDGRQPDFPVVEQPKSSGEKVAPPPNTFAEGIDPITGKVRTIITLGATGELYIAVFGFVLS